MILNLTKLKTQSLLLLCRDIILTYKDKNIINENVDKNLIEYMNSINDTMLKQIQKVTKDNKYYQNNSNNSTVKAVIYFYKFLEKELGKVMVKNREFNPSMLYFSLLAMWFRELSKESKSKEYIFFILYTYSDVYDKLLINVEDLEFKKLNVSMIEIAENIINKYDKAGLK